MDPERVMVLTRVISLSAGRSLPAVHVWPEGKGRRGKPQITLVGDTPKDALRAVVVWLAAGCPTSEQIAAGEVEAIPQEQVL